VKFIPGVSTFGRQIEWMHTRAPSPMGTRSGTILSGNDSPTPGTDTEGATAVLQSYCKADLRKQSCGAALDLRLHPSSVTGENGIAALIALQKAFLRLGGFFMQVDLPDAEVLKDAREHPEQYKTLSVRVSGWNARFVTLDKEWQDMIIERTSGGVL
ncbi:MAG: glycine radical domain-containing protein, partial [Eubacteriales bacterium]